MDLVGAGFVYYAMIGKSEDEILEFALIIGFILVSMVVVIFILLRILHWSLTLDATEKRLVYSRAWNLTKAHRIFRPDEVASVTIQ